jgi:hypothetical protein
MARFDHHGINASMDHNVRALERAFELARSGKCASVTEIRKRLKAEGYAAATVAGTALSKQLRALIATARGSIAARQSGENA